MSRPLGFETGENLEALGTIQTPQQLAVAWETADLEQTVNLFCSELGDMLVGDAKYYEVEPTYLHNRGQISILSEPVNRQAQRRISFTGLKIDPLEEEINALLGEDEPLSVRSFESAALRDFTLDIETGSVPRAAWIEIGKTVLGDKWQHSTKCPPMHERVAEHGREVLKVHRGVRYEHDRFSLPIPKTRAQTRVLLALLRYKHFITPTFQRDVTVRSVPVFAEMAY